MKTPIKIAMVSKGKIFAETIDAIGAGGVWAYDERAIVTHVPTGRSIYRGDTMAATRRMFRALAKELPTWGKRAKWCGRMKGRTGPVVAILKRVDPRLGGVERV